MKKFFRVISLSVIFILLLESFSMIAYANDSPSKYAENCFQFDMEKINLYVENNKNVSVQVNEDNNLFNKIKMNKQKEKFQTFLNNYPDIEQQIIDMVNKNNQIVAFGYTEAELVVDDYGNMIRVEDEKKPINNVLLGYTAFAADETAKGDSSKKYYFSLVTTVTKRGSKNPYTY